MKSQDNTQKLSLQEKDDPWNPLVLARLRKLAGPVHPEWENPETLNRLYLVRKHLWSVRPLDFLKGEKSWT